MRFDVCGTFGARDCHTMLCEQFCGPRQFRRIRRKQWRGLDKRASLELAGAVPVYDTAIAAVLGIPL